jgi:micrococcal nuclease
MEYQKQDCDVKYRCALDRVIDGDTIDVCIDLGFDVMTRKRCRLLGIDTPESRTSDKEEKVYGLQSKKKLREWCLKAIESDKDDIHLELRCKKGKTSDKYGRVLAEVWVIDGETETNINEWLCKNHYAVPYHGQNKDDIQGAHLKNREILGTLL